MNPAQLPIGSRLGPYEIRRVLGRGGMGVVYEALDPAKGVRVAIKLLRAAREPEHLERFRREARVATRVAPTARRSSWAPTPAPSRSSRSAVWSCTRRDRKVRAGESS